MTHDTLTPSLEAPDWDDCEWLGDDEDGVYIGWTEGEGHARVVAVLDCNSGGFTHTLYDRVVLRSELVPASQTAVSLALDWLLANSVVAQECDAAMARIYADAYRDANR